MFFFYQEKTAELFLVVITLKILKIFFLSFPPNISCSLFVDYYFIASTRRF